MLYQAMSKHPLIH